MQSFTTGLVPDTPPGYSPLPVNRLSFDTSDVDSALRAHHCYEAVDRVSGDPATTAFKRRARLHQALWRAARQMPMGTHPTRPRPGESGRPLGSRLEIGFATATGANFLSAGAREAAAHRVANPEPKQTLNADRLYADLLSSMPMCFNLYGPLSGQVALANAVAHSWWPDLPGHVAKVRFEWSPGRQLPGRYLENRSAFDVAFESHRADGSLGIVGVETKYHEHCVAESVPSAQRLERYRKVCYDSGVFREGAAEAIVGTELQQLWLDHLLALSLLQEGSGHYSWVKFVLLHPAGNPSFSKAAAAYAEYLADDSTFEIRTIESMLHVDTYPANDAAAFRERYLWTGSEQQRTANKL